MRRSLALALAAVFCLPLAAAPVDRANAQEEPPVRATLLEQTPDWNDRTDPDVTLRILVENTGEDTFEDLRIGITLWSPAVSRTAFEQSLSGDPPGGSVLLGQTRPREGSLTPGETREFDVPVDLPLGQLSSTQSFVYPLTIDVRSHFASLASIRTAVVYLVRRPALPLAFSWTFVVHAQLAVRADGVFESPAFETAISPGGRLAGQISALSHLVGSGVGVNVVVSPLVVYQLLEMQDGYRVLDGGAVRSVEAGRDGSAVAAETIDRLREIAGAPNVELSALPYAEPLLPSLASGDLARDLGLQIQLGRDLVSSALQSTPSTTVFRPPRSALDDASLDELPASGISTLLLDPGAVDVAQDVQGFAPAPLVSLAAQNASLEGVVADPAVQDMLLSGTAEEDPVLAAHAILVDLAEIWLQAPGDERALAIALGDETPAPGAFYPPLVRALSTAPWLAKTKASHLVEDRELRPTTVSGLVPSPSAFSFAYVEGLRQARRRVASLRSMLVRPSDVPTRLDRLLLLAESQRFVGDEAPGTALVDAVDRTVTSVFGSIRPQVDQPITLTSSAVRDVPIAVRNAADVPLRVTIRIFGQHLASAVERTRTLPPESTQTIPMDLQLHTTGRFTVRVQVLTPSGRPIGGRNLIVRSTAYNRIALWITLGAALLAMLVWARRFLPRRTT